MKKVEKLLDLIEASQNKGWGFYGAIKDNWDLTDQMVNRVWDYMTKLLMDTTKKDKKTVETFLDSRDARHLADEIGFYSKIKPGDLASVIKAIDAWIKNPKANYYIRKIK